MQKSKRNNPVLYLTYDGLLDPLGGSQILPYLLGSMDSMTSIVIISFEKNNCMQKDQNDLTKLLKIHDVTWLPLKFSKNFGAISKVWDLVKLFIASSAYAIYYQPKLIHCRGHVTSLIGCWLKFIIRSKLLFDFRGLWVDERVDKGGWDLSKSSDRKQYKLFKFLEKFSLKYSDHIVVLTNMVVSEIRRISHKSLQEISVIPCCADYDLFRYPSNESKKKLKQRLQLPDDKIILGYHGSIGSMYRIDRFLKLIEIGAIINNSVFGLVITRDTELLKKIIENSLPERLHPLIKILSGTRDEMPFLLQAIDISVSFIQPSYARQASSPTKIAESLALGIPVICNAGVGDLDSQINLIQGGKFVDYESDKSLTNIASDLHSIIDLGGMRLRTESQKLFDLNHGINAYKMIYNDCLR